jgi:hypothetical protein
MVPRANGAPLRLRTYFFPDLDATPGLTDGYLDDVRRYLDMYSNEIGTYPYTEFSVVASPLPTGFGMATLTYLGAQVLKLPFIRASSLGHEVLHNWWGNGVYVDYAHGNWSEGLTTFMADYAYKERESPAAAREMRQGWLRDFAAVPNGSHQTLASFRSRVHGAAAAVGYGKSAMVFVMLRDLLGEEAFRKGVRRFWERNQFRAASWSDLRAAFEEASGRSLSPFFAQWLARAEGPVVKIANASVAEHQGKHRLTVHLEQAAPPYSLRLPIEIVSARGSETRWIDLTKEREAVTLDLDDTPQGVRLDPELRVWRLLDPEQLPPILRQWIVARSPRLVLASTHNDLREAAQSLAARFFEAAPQPATLDALSRTRDPLLLIGLHNDVDAALARAGMPARPANLTARGTAQVWTIAGASAPVAVISVADVAALHALERPLPHYGAQSLLVFEGSRMIEKGVWPAAGKVVPVK